MAKSTNMSVTLIIIAVIVIASAVIIGPGIVQSMKTQRILKEGVSATAVIKAVTDTGNRYNKNPEVRLTLEVTPASGAPFQAEVTTVISVIDVPKYQPGTLLNVKYDPKQPTQVVLVK